MIVIKFEVLNIISTWHSNLITATTSIQRIYSKSVSIMRSAEYFSSMNRRNRVRFLLYVTFLSHHLRKSFIQHMSMFLKENDFTQNKFTKKDLMIMWSYCNTYKQTKQEYKYSYFLSFVIAEPSSRCQRGTPARAWLCCENLCTNATENPKQSRDRGPVGKIIVLIDHDWTMVRKNDNIRVQSGGKFFPRSFFIANQHRSASRPNPRTCLCG